MACKNKKESSDKIEQDIVKASWIITSTCRGGRIGTAIGTVICPGFGTLAGFIFGGFLGAILGDSLSD